MKNNPPGMTLIVKTATRLSFGLILLYGIYIALRGNDGPGSGFAAGVIIALAFVMMMLSFGKDAVIKRMGESKGLCVFSLSALVLLGVIARGILHAHGGAIAGAEITSLGELCTALMVGAGLFLIFLTLVLLTGGAKKS